MTTELMADPGHVRADLATVRRAVREGWEIPEQLLSALPKVAGAMALDKKEKSAVRLKAIETLLKMKGQNDDAQPQTPQQTTINVGVNVDARIDERRNRAIAIAERFRNGTVLVTDSTRTD